MSAHQSSPTGTGGPGPAAAPVLRVSDRAKELVLRARDEEADGAALALWLEVSGVQGSSFTYDMYFQRASDAGPGDWVGDTGDLVVVVPEASVGKVRGSTLDVSSEGGEEGMVIINPNPPAPATSSPPGLEEADLSSEVAQRVKAVLDEQVNPSIAMHGGRADLVGVQDDVAYLRLSGGCQGCGLARVTLSQGIEVAIRESVPEITSVVDVTDHASGTNPYFEAAKK
ncbi:MAG TPA: NifU family protein [Acidimicrobiales bacterium]|nr:NifU family protein [Acidimicrobiales bacterium]